MSTTTSSTPRPIRKATWQERIRDMPHEWLLRITEEWEILDWETIQGAAR
jgi:hypothetical protein